MGFVKSTVNVIRRGIGMRGILKNLQPVIENVSKAGFPKDGVLGKPSQTGSGHPPFTSMSHVAEIALYLDLGTENIPPRPFFLNLTNEHKEALKKVTSKQWWKVLRGQLSEEILIKMGNELVNKIKNGIENYIPPPNGPKTIKAKGFDHPIIDTRQMINSLQVVVNKK